MTKGRGHRMLRLAPALALAMAVVLTGCSGSPADTSPTVAQKSGPATLAVWADAPRTTQFKNYQADGITLKIETIPNTTKDRIQKLILANKAGQGWPDIFEVQIYQAQAFSQPPYDFAADISGYLDPGMLDQYPATAMAPCVDGNAVYCLPNEVGPYVLWYNKPLMKEFGYTIPTTWQEFQQIGLDVAENHPGYVVGGSGFIDEAYLESSRCPIVELIAPKTVYSNVKDPRCTRMASLIDPLIEAGSIARMKATDPAYIKDYGAAGKWLMMVGPSWYAKFLFGNQFQTPNGTLGIAPPLKWEGESQAWTGNNGGVYYQVSRHSPYLEQSVKVIQWMSSGPNQTSQDNVTVPAYIPARKEWVKQFAESGAITAENGTVGSVLETAVSQMVPDHSFLPVDNITAQLVLLPIIQEGGTIAGGLDTWQTAIDNQLQAAGYKVVHSK